MEKETFRRRKVFFMYPVDILSALWYLTQSTE